MFAVQHSLDRKVKGRVELHVQLASAIRHETIWEIMRQKKIPVPGDGSLRALKQALTIPEPKDHRHFLSIYKNIMPLFVGDLEAIERFSFELVEDKAIQGVAYCEARFCPHKYLPQVQTQTNGVSDIPNIPNGDIDENERRPPSIPPTTGVTANNIVEAVLAGFSKGEEKYGTKVKLLMCCLRSYSECYWDLLRLCEEYKDKGVVGICIVGQKKLDDTENDIHSTILEDVFRAAKEKGIHRTVQIDEYQNPKCIKVALDNLFAERISQAYAALEDEEIYQRCLRDGIHFEISPYSSYMTGAVSPSTTKKHPMLRLVEDGASFSISATAETITQKSLDDEYDLLRTWGLTEANFAKANFQAALHSFLKPKEKQELINNLKEAYGVVDYQIPVEVNSSPPTPSSSEIKRKYFRPAFQIASWKDRL